MMAKAGLTVKQVSLADARRVRKEKVILLVGQQKLNVHQQPKKKTSSKRISWKDGRVKKSNGGFIAKGCGKVMNNRRKVTTIS